MPKNLLAVSHLTQRTEADCLPVCTQMVTRYFGLNLKYHQLVKLLGTRWFGTPFRNLRRLKQLGISVLIVRLSLTGMTAYLENSYPVIACLHTADLSYWSEATDHVVVVIGTDDYHVYVNDPSLSKGQKAIPRVEFELAQLHYDHLCAIIKS